MLTALIAALCLWAAVPYGSAASWATSIVAVGGWVLFVLHVFAPGRRDGASDGAFAFRTGCLVLFCLWMISATFGSSDRGASYSALALWLAYLAVATVCAARFGSRRLATTFVTLIALAGVGEAAVGILNHSSGALFHSRFLSSRMAGTFSSGNSFAGFLTLTTLATTGVLFSRTEQLLSRAGNRSVKALLMVPDLSRPLIAIVLWGIAWGVQTSAILLSGSRGAIIAGLLALAILAFRFILHMHRRPHGRRLALTFLLPALAVLAAATGAGYWLTASRFQMVVEDPFASGLGRTLIWRHALRLALAHPLGTGPGTFATAYMAFQPPGYGDARAYHAHNDYLEWLCELGIPGFLLLVLAVALYLRHGFRALWRPIRDRRLWLYHGAFCAGLAGLIHAFVEFNLSARPGVAVSFFALVGLSLARPDRGHRGGCESDDALPPPRRRGPVLLLLLVAALALFVVSREARAVRAALLQESATVSLGLTPDPYFWLTPAPRQPADAVAALSKARDLTPCRARSHYLLALGRHREFLHRRATAVAANLISGVESNAVVAAVHSTLRDEEARILRSCVADLRETARLSPFDADAHALLARHLAELALIGDPTAEMARQSAERALSLGASDVKVLDRLFDAFASLAMSASDESAREPHRAKLLDIGHRLLALERTPNPVVPVYWDAAGIPPDRALAHPDTSVRVLWFLYRHYIRKADATVARFALGRIEQACSQPHAFDTRPLLDAKETDALTDCRTSLVRERSRWALREGRWGDYRAMEPDRNQAFAHRASQVSEGGLWTAASDLLHVRLDDWRLRVGLTSDQQAALCERLLLRGEALGASLRLAELALQESNAAVEALRPLSRSGVLSDAPKPLASLVGARLLIADGEIAAAEKALQAIAPTDIPHWYAHRIALLRAGCLARLHRRAESLDLILEGVRLCPSDPDLLLAYARELPGNRPVVYAKAGTRRLYDLLADTTPPIRLDADFAGGRVVLAGYGLSESPAARTPAGRPMRLRLFWRVFGAVPPDLTTGVSLKRADNSATLWSTRVAFSSVGAARFAAGLPPFGSVIVIETTVPLDVASGNLLSIELHAPSAGRVLTTAEGLSSVQILDPPRSCAMSATILSPEYPSAVVRLTPLDATVLQSVTNILSSAGIPAIADRRPTNAAPDGAFLIALAVTNFSPESGFPLGSIGPEAFAAQSLRNGVSIASPTSAGLCRGLGQWLQESVGAWSFLPDRRFAIVPAAPLRAQPTSMLDAPAAHLRYGSLPLAPGPHRTDADLQAWSLRAGLTSPALRLAFSHNLHRIYSPAHHFASHPEWFPEVAGARTCPTNDNWQPCLSAPGLRERAVEAATDFFAQHPDRPMFAVGINDSSNWCQCAACATLCPPEERARSAGDRWWSEPYWRFVNDVAAAVAAKHPDRRLGAIAYAAVSKPPAFDIAPNVTVFHCEDAGARFDPGYAARSATELATWSQRTHDLGRYGYPGLATWVFPRYCLAELAQDIRLAAETGIRQFYMEFSHVEWLDGVIPWAVAELLWNPWQDPVALQASFCGRAFGRAAAPMGRYFDTLAELWRGEKRGLWFDGLFDLATQAHRYPPDAWKRLDDLLAEARRRAEGDEAALARIEAVSAPLAFARAIARESALMDSLASPPTDAASLRHAQAVLAGLNRAIGERQRLLNATRSQPWAPSLARALSIGNTFHRWNRQQDTAVRSVSNWVASVESACADLLPPSNR